MPQDKIFKGVTAVAECQRTEVIRPIVQEVIGADEGGMRFHLPPGDRLAVQALLQGVEWRDAFAVFGADKQFAVERQIIGRIAGRRLAVIGDSMVDRFLWGRVDRISPEAPVPVVRIERETVKLGGAANVAANIRALGAEVVLFGIAAADEAGRQLRDLLTERGIDPAGLVPVSRHYKPPTTTH